MTSGVNFSIILLIWLVGLIVGFYILFPDITKTLQTNNNINETSLTANSVEQQNISTVEYVEYSPLGIFEKFNF